MGTQDSEYFSSHMPLCYFSVQFQAKCASSTVFLINATSRVKVKVENSLNAKGVKESKKCQLLLHGPESIAVKVFTNAVDYDNEIQSLTQMANLLVDENFLRIPQWRDPSHFYALAHAHFQ